MAKLDVYLRSIERFGAAGALLVSGQAVTLRFPTGDRHATQVTPHDQLVAIIREVAPPAVLDQIDKNRPARFDHESSGTRYAVSIAPRPGSWQVTIAAIVAEVVPVRAATAPPVAAVAPPPIAQELAIERGQYDALAARPVQASSGSALLDELTRAARTARATDLFLGSGIQPMQRIGSELAAIGGAVDAETISRELGIVAPGEARAAWTEQGAAVFAYGDGTGRVRVTLGRDQRGPTAALRFLPDEPPGLDRLFLDLGDWLARTGLVVIAGASGAGKTTAQAAIVRALADHHRRTVVIEDPIEFAYASPWISQRAVGPHVASVTAGVAMARLEGADAIAIGAIASVDAAAAVVEAVAGGHFVVTTVTAPERSGERLVIDRIVDHLPPDRRELARALLGSTLLGTISAIAGPRGRTLELARPGRPA